MNIELTTDNLRKSCRVCLNQGELNIWEDLISLRDDDYCESSRNSEVTALELFKIYEKYNDELLGLNDELKLLCYSCLDELTNSFIFFKKAKHMNRQIQQLYKEAQKIETEQLIEVEYVDVVDNECSDESNLDVLESQTDQHQINQEFEMVDDTEAEVALQDYIEEIAHEKEEDAQLIECNSSEPIFDADTIVQTQKAANKTKRDLGVCDNDITEQSSVETTTDVYFDDVKSIVKKQSCNKPQRDKATRSSGPAQPPHEDGSLIVTQFLPSTAHIVLDTMSTASTTQEDEDDIDGVESIQFQTPDLSTVDYAAVEVKSANLEQIIGDEMKLQNTKPPTPENAEILDIYGNKEQLQESDNTVYICKFCPQAFSAPHYLIAHVRKSHVCKYCTQAFAKSMDLFVHIRQAHHQHKCAICCKELSSHSNLRVHIKRVHGIRLPAQVALLDYRPPSGNVVETATMDNTLDEMDMYF